MNGDGKVKHDYIWQMTIKHIAVLIDEICEDNILKWGCRTFMA